MAYTILNTYFIVFIQYFKNIYIPINTIKGIVSSTYNWPTIK